MAKSMFDSVDDFIGRFRRAMLAKAELDDDARRFDSVTTVLILKLATGKFAIGDGGGYLASEPTLAVRCRCSRTKVRDRLRLLARYGWIKVHRVFLPGQRMFSTSEIIFGDMLNAVVAGSVYKPSLLNRMIGVMVEIGFRRHEVDEDLQGFTGDTLYGEKEADDQPRIQNGRVVAGNAPPIDQDGEGAAETPMDRMNALAAQVKASDVDRESKAAANRQWGLWARKFVNGAATLWDAGQQRMGRPAQRPIWDGDYAKLSPSNQRSYRDLVRVFEAEGGYRAGLAWYLFMSTLPGYDAKGRLISDPKHPHKGWASHDKQPSFFAKYFNAICADPLFQEYAHDAEIRRNLVLAWGDELLNLNPRWQRQVEAYRLATPTEVDAFRRGEEVPFAPQT